LEGNTMAEPRKSAKQTAARQRAREGAAQFRELQDKLEEFAAEYFIAVDVVEEMGSETEREIAKIRERAERDIAQLRQKSERQTEAARTEAELIIGRMLDAGSSYPEVAARLGIPVKEVRKAARNAIVLPAATSFAGTNFGGTNEE
jgi:hypothetical protein